jgi:hypothetical protein
MTNKKILVGMLALALIFGMTVVGCGDDPGDGGGGGNVSGGGSGTGTVKLTNSTGTDLRKLKITNDGKQVKYDEVVNRNAVYPNVPRGLCTMSFDLGLNGRTYSHSFTVSSGETVSINFTQNYNFVITRSSGGSGGGDNPPAVTDTGSLRISNNTTYTLNSVYISQNGSIVKSDNSLGANASKTYTGVPVGSCEVLVSRATPTRFYYWKGTVTVSKNSTATITIRDTGWY